MSSAPNTAPWQLAAVSPASGIASAALLALALDSTIAWNAVPLVASLTFLIVPIVVGIRVVRGFPTSLRAAGVTLFAALVVAGFALTSAASRPPAVSAVPTVAVVLSAGGLAATALAWLAQRRQRRSTVITIELTESGSFAVVSSGTRR